METLRISKGVLFLALNSLIVLPILIYLMQEFEGVGALTSIELRGRNGGFEGLADFLTWPARLEHFSLTGDLDWSRDVNLRTIRSALLPHRDCLRSLIIGHCKATRSINVSDFPNLESFCLYARTMHVDPRRGVLEHSLRATPPEACLGFLCGGFARLSEYEMPRFWT